MSEEGERNDESPVAASEGPVDTVEENSYTALSFTVGLDKEEEATDQPGPSRRNQPGCFNCDQPGHNVGDCPQPVNRSNIAANRRKFASQRQNQNKRFYAGADKFDELVAKFKPGEISDDLRKALDLGRTDLPHYIYNMRQRGLVEGYPPGYFLNSMKHNKSNMLKFHVESASHLADEDGEIHEEKVNPDKVIWYEGFNTQPRHTRERGPPYKYPPRDEYLRMLDQHAERLHLSQLAADSHEKQQNGKTSRHKKFTDTDDEEITLDREPDKKKARNEAADGTIDLSDDDLDAELDDADEHNGKQARCVTPVSTIRPSVGRGNSLGEVVGTPTVASDSDRPAPELESFTVGILPFEFDEETRVSGKGYLSMAKLLKRRREQNTPAAKPTKIHFD